VEGKGYHEDLAGVAGGVSDYWRLVGKVKGGVCVVVDGKQIGFALVDSEFSLE
jgi:hypothetical protein